MAVLIEGISVVVYVKFLVSRIGDDWKKYFTRFEIGDEDYHEEEGLYFTDGILACFRFYHPDDVSQFVKRLESFGILYRHDNSSIGLTIVDQKLGATTKTKHLIECENKFIDIDGKDVSLMICRSAKYIPVGKEVIEYPSNWSYSNSLSKCYNLKPTTHFTKELSWKHEMNKFKPYFADGKKGMGTRWYSGRIGEMYENWNKSI